MSRWRFWLVYTAGWLPLYAVYALAFSSGGEPLRVVLAAAAYDTLPPALLGLAVLQLSRKRRWADGGSRLPFLAAHLAAALAYAVASTAGTLGLFVLDQWLDTGRIDPARFPSYLIVWLMLVALLLYAALASGAYAFRLEERLREERARAARAEALRNRAELEALRAQLNPHFLFNTLHSLLALVRSDPEAAEDGLERFGDLLRYPVRIHQEDLEEVELESEWAFTRGYLELEGLRLGDRLAVDAAAEPEALRCRVPTFSLQPLVENAIRHGVAPRSGGGRVTVRASVRDGRLEMRVADDGPGAELGGGPGDATGAGRGLGLRLLQQRLAALFGPEASLEAGPGRGGGFEVVVRLPARREDG